MQLHLLRHKFIPTLQAYESRACIFTEVKTHACSWRLWICVAMLWYHNEMSNASAAQKQIECLPFAAMQSECQYHFIKYWRCSQNLYLGSSWLKWSRPDRDAAVQLQFSQQHFLLCHIRTVGASLPTALGSFSPFPAEREHFDQPVFQSLHSNQITSCTHLRTKILDNIIWCCYNFFAPI